MDKEHPQDSVDEQHPEAQKANGKRTITWSEKGLFLFKQRSRMRHGRTGLWTSPQRLWPVFPQELTFLDFTYLPQQQQQTAPWEEGTRKPTRKERVRAHDTHRCIHLSSERWEPGQVMQPLLPPHPWTQSNLRFKTPNLLLGKNSRSWRPYHTHHMNQEPVNTRKGKKTDELACTGVYRTQDRGGGDDDFEDSFTFLETRSPGGAELGRRSGERED